MPRRIEGRRRTPLRQKHSTINWRKGDDASASERGASRRTNAAVFLLFWLTFPPRDLRVPQNEKNGTLDVTPVLVPCPVLSAFFVTCVSPRMRTDRFDCGRGFARASAPSAWR